MNVQAESANALTVVCRESEGNQNFIISIGGIPPLVKLVQSSNIEVQVSAAGALQSLAQSNAVSQTRIAELGGVNPLIRLLKSNPRNLDVQERASGALWALSGDCPSKQRDIGTKIGIEMLIVLLESKSEKIQFVAAKALSTLSCGTPKHQKKIRESGGVLPLVRMLKQSASERVLLAVIGTLAALSIGLAHTPVKLNQTAIANGGAIKSLVQLMGSTDNALVKVQSAYAIACITLAHTDNQKTLGKEKFGFNDLIELLYCADRAVSLGAGRALTTFAYNNIPTQKEIVKGGDIQYEQFIRFLDSDDENEQGNAAFQCPSLFFLNLPSPPLLIIPSLVTVGAMERLISLLTSPAELVRSSAATAVGYMTFNRGAMRILLTACRRNPETYQLLFANLSGGKISDTFVREWEYCLTVGLPSQSSGLVPIDHQVMPDHTTSQSTLINQFKTTTIDTPTYGTTITEELMDVASTHRYTSASSVAHLYFVLQSELAHVVGKRRRGSPYGRANMRGATEDKSGIRAVGDRKLSWARRAPHVRAPVGRSPTALAHYVGKKLSLTVWRRHTPFDSRQYAQIGSAAPDSAATRSRVKNKKEPTETSKQPIRTRYLGHVKGYQPISDQYDSVGS
eukprot:sb/3463033/